MKKVFALIISLMLASAFAGEDYTINSGTVEAYAASDMPAVFYLKNHTVGESIQIDLTDLHNDSGPAMLFTLEVYGNNANGERLSAVREGDVTFFIPGSLVGEHTVLVLFDNNRHVHGAGHQYVEQPEWPAAQLGFSAMQDVPTEYEVEVYSKDHHLGNPMIYVWSLYLKNTGAITLANPSVRYFFTTEDSATALNLVDYYTPLADVQLLTVPGTNEYALEFNYEGTTLESGETTLTAVENQVQLYYNGYASIDKFNDYSNPIPEAIGYLPSSTLFHINNKCAVYDENGTLIGGTEVTGYDADQFVPVQ